MLSQYGLNTAELTHLRSNDCLHRWCVSLSDRVDMDRGGLEIIIKARELVAQGEAAPHAFVAELDASW